MIYAGRYKYLTYLSWLLSAISALVAPVPFIYIWRIIRDVLDGNMRNITHYGWMAVLFAVISVVVYITGLICSHMSAFRISANLRKMSERMRYNTFQIFLFAKFPDYIDAATPPNYIGSEALYPWQLVIPLLRLRRCILQENFL